MAFSKLFSVHAPSLLAILISSILLALSRRFVQVNALAASEIDQCTIATMSRYFKKVPADSLYVSEPDPSWFGNGPNEPKKKGWTNGNWLKSRFHFNFGTSTSIAMLGV